MTYESCCAFCPPFVRVACSRCAASASAACRLNAGVTCEEVSAVRIMLACPKISCTTFIGCPDSSSIVAQLCRASYNRTAGASTAPASGSKRTWSRRPPATARLGLALLDDPRLSVAGGGAHLADAPKLGALSSEHQGMWCVSPKQRMETFRWAGSATFRFCCKGYSLGLVRSHARDASPEWK